MAVPAPSRRCPPAMRMPLQHMLPMLPDGLQATGHLPATRSKSTPLLCHYDKKEYLCEKQTDAPCASLHPLGT